MLYPSTQREDQGASVSNPTLPWLLILAGAVGSAIGIFNPWGWGDAWARGSGWIRFDGIGLFRIPVSDKALRIFNTAASLVILLLGIYIAIK
jgi:hypothetical protein